MTFFFSTTTRHLLVNAKDRRVVICESILCPSAFRDTLAKVLFKHFEVKKKKNQERKKRIIPHVNWWLRKVINHSNFDECSLKFNHSYKILISSLNRFLQASSVLFAVGQVNCLLGLGTHTGLVVDVGYNETVVLPVSISL